MQAKERRKSGVGRASLGSFAILAALGGRAEAQPFAYVTNGGDPSNSSPGTVSVIDTATNMGAGFHMTVGFSPEGVAVTLDGKRVYVANNGGPRGSNTVSVIDTTMNPPTVATSRWGINPSGSR
jgi:YVTN family beta-propeller protein